MKQKKQKKHSASFRIRRFIYCKFSRLELPLFSLGKTFPQIPVAILAIPEDSSELILPEIPLFIGTFPQILIFGQDILSGASMLLKFLYLDIVFLIFIFLR
jgi:hypothetical protein